MRHFSPPYEIGVVANSSMNRQYKDKKGYCEDLDEGKWSFIQIHSLHNAKPATKAILNSLIMERHAAGCAGKGHKEFMLSIFQETGSLSYTADTIHSLWGEINLEIDALERYLGKVNKPLRAIMDALKL
jgi:geranylgeranyl pyrophosphate synthase